MTQEATVDQEMKQREALVRTIARELGTVVARTGGRVERKEEHLVAELYYQPNIVWALEFPVKIVILVRPVHKKQVSWHI